MTFFLFLRLFAGKNLFLKSTPENKIANETAGAKMNMLENISKYGFKYDCVKDREAIVKNMTVEQIKNLSGKYLNADRMIRLIVGDAKTQLPRLKELGFGEPVLINKKIAEKQNFVKPS